MPLKMPAASPSATVPKLSRSPASMTTFTDSSCTIVRINEYWLPPWMSLTSRARSAVSASRGAAEYFCCNAVDRAMTLRRYGATWVARASTSDRMPWLRCRVPRMPVDVKVSWRCGW